MNVLIAGSSGMIGQLVLQLCLQSDLVKEVRCLVRKPSGIHHIKMKETIIKDFELYSQNDPIFKDIQVAFFCLGAYTGQVTDDELRKITVDYAVRFAGAMEMNSPGARFCLLSGAGSDRTEKSRTSFARYKGMAENYIDKFNLQFYSLRPAYIFPVEKRKEPNFGYRIMRHLYPLIKLFGKNFSITSTGLAHALFNVGMHGSDHRILENKDILAHANRIN